MVAARDAVKSYEGLQNNTNVSNTALAQSQIAGTVTQGNLTAAMVQLMAFEAAKEAAEDYESEITRREALAVGCVPTAIPTSLRRAHRRDRCQPANAAGRHELSHTRPLIR